MSKIVKSYSLRMIGVSAQGLHDISLPWTKNHKRLAGINVVFSSHLFKMELVSI